MIFYKRKKIIYSYGTFFKIERGTTMKKIRELLDEAVQREVERFATLTTTEEKKQASEVIANLRKLQLEEEKNRAQAIGDNTQRALQFVAEIAKAGLSAIVFVGCYKMGLKFEINGTVTSSFFKNLIGRVKI